MTGQTLSPNAAAQPPGVIRRAAAFVAFAALMGVGFALHAGQPALAALRERLADAVRGGLRSGQLADLAEAIAAGAGLIGVVAAQGLVVILVLLAIEATLAGPPRRWRIVGFALGLQALTAVFYFFSGPIIGRLLPWDTGLGPLLKISEDAIPALLQPAVPLLGAVILILFTTLGSYWSHRAQHRFAILWRFHAVHHSVEDMDAANSFVHPLDVVGERIALIALGVVLKVDFDTFVWAAAFTSFYDRLIHSRSPIHFGVLGHVLLDNRHHFIHHSTDRAHFDRNFGAYFSLWDRLFGTYTHPVSDRLQQTGLADRKPPASVRQFVTGRLEPR